MSGAWRGSWQIREWLARGRIQLDRQAVDAVPGVLVGHALAPEHMAQVRVAPGAADLGAGHAHAPVLDLLHGARDGVVEARPAAVRVELRTALEQLGAARPAVVDALGLGADVFPAPRCL